MAQQLRLRIRGPSGVSQTTIASTSSISDFLAVTFSLTSIPPDQQDLKTGFPPKSLSIPQDTSSRSVEELGIKNGDVVTVVDVPEGAARGGEAGATGRVREPVKEVERVKPESTSAAVLPKPAAAAASWSSTGTSSASRSRPELAASAPAPAPVMPQPRAQPSRPAPASSFSASAQPPAKKAKRGDKNVNGTCVEYDGGFLVLRVVPDDNSCLFNALALLLDRRPSDYTDSDNTAAQRLRMQVAELIRSNTSEWNAGMLGRAPSEYVAQILNMNAWGGAIELSILSTHFRTEICSVDVETGRMDRFGDHFDQRVVVFYSGIHYDAVTHSFMDPKETGGAGSDWPPVLDFDTTVFDKTAEGGLKDAQLDEALRALADKLRKESYFTNTATFDLKCDDCGAGMKGEKEAREHATNFMHGRFSQWQ